MMKTVPYSTVVPQMWCLQLTQKKIACFIFQAQLIYGDQEAIMALLNVIEDDCYFGGVPMRLSWAV